MNDQKHHTPHRASYVFGFIFSLAMTLCAFALAYLHIQSGHTFISHDVMVTSIIVLAVAQLFAQAVFFLHLGEFPSNRNRLLIALFVLCMVLCVALGSIWIMHNLSQNMMPHDISAYLHKEN